MQLLNTRWLHMGSLVDSSSVKKIFKPIELRIKQNVLMYLTMLRSVFKKRVFFFILNFSFDIGL